MDWSCIGTNRLNSSWSFGCWGKRWGSSTNTPNSLVPSQYCGTVWLHKQIHFLQLILGILNYFTEGANLRVLKARTAQPLSCSGDRPRLEEHKAAWSGARCSLASLSYWHRATHWIIHSNEQGCRVLGETSGSLLAPCSPSCINTASWCPQCTELPRSLCVLCDNTSGLPFCWQQTWEMFQHNL